MPKLSNRRNFLKATAGLAAVASTGGALSAVDHHGHKKQEYYEFRVYKTASADKKAVLNRYLEKALLPGLNRMGIDRIGVFTNRNEPADLNVYVLIPYKTLDLFAAVNPALQADKKYLSAAKEYYAAPKDDPVFTRIESKLHKAFAGMPVIEMPKQTAGNKPRLFELRVYEAHTEEKAALKVDMFNSGEMQVMRDVGLAPVFYGEVIIGDDVPNLMYMTSASNQEEHDKHWDGFRTHPDWLSQKEDPKYADTVSKNTKWFLIPTSYSQI